MALSHDFLQQLQATFVTEADEHLLVINRALLAIEQQGESTADELRLAEIFRAAHSLKGAARAVGEEAVADLAHRLESIFSRMRSGDLHLLPEQYDLLFRALDSLKILVQNNGATPEGLPVQELATELDRIDAAPAAPVPAQPPAPVSWPAASTLTAATADESVRVTVTKLDAIMEQVGELKVARLNAAQQQRRLRGLLEEIEQWRSDWRHRQLRCAAANAGAQEPRGADGEVLAHLEESETRLNHLARRLWELWRQAEGDNRRSGLIIAELDDLVRRARLMPIGVAFEALPRMVRDLARTLDKQVRLEVEGSDTEADRSVLELIKDPLVHLLRNAVDHGIESPAARLAAGKPAEGVIRLRAQQQGDNILVEVADDGAGIDPERVRARAVHQGQLRGDEAAALSTHEALWLIFRSGLSTRAEVSAISGRGVGLDVVREHIERLHGTIDVDSCPGQGTRFVLRLPLTVATTLCVLAQSGGDTFALPASGVVRILRLHPDQVGHAAGRPVLRDEGRPLALDHLAAVLGLAEPDAAAGIPGAKAGQMSRGETYAVVLGIADKRAALLVDAVADVQELVVKRLPRPFLHTHHLTGAAILGTGQVVIVLNVPELLRSACRPGQRATALAQDVAPAAQPPQAPVILVADDSFTTRTLEKTLLETAGYRVRVAADGLEAWTLLQTEAINLLVSDVMMPRMNGFELTSKIRGDARLQQLPVILVTAQESAADRERGSAVGADAYIVKSAFDQESLLSTIRRLIA